jgi:hypothetical protein
LLENALFGFGLSKLGLFDGFSIQIVTSKVEMMTCLSGKIPIPLGQRSVLPG